MNKQIYEMMKCIEVKENTDGSADIIFSVDDEFKETYKKIFNLKRWSKKHFNNLITEAITNFEKTIKND